jgi:hypothetical protein
LLPRSRASAEMCFRLFVKVGTSGDVVSKVEYGFDFKCALNGGAPMSIVTRGVVKQVGGTNLIAKSDRFMTGHQVLLIRMHPRKLRAWTANNATVQEVLLRVFPKLREDDRQREAAGRWARFIQLYWRVSGRGGAIHDRLAEPDGVYTLKDVAAEMGISYEQAKSLKTRILRAAEGRRCDGTGERRRAKKVVSCTPPHPLWRETSPELPPG